MNRFKDSIAAALVATLFAPAAGIAGGPLDSAFDRIVGFGDSLSDPGNFFAMTGQNTTAPYAPIPSAPYAIGGNHFTDGSTWIEQLSAKLGDPLSSQPAFRADIRFTNFAFGGARARSVGDKPNLTMQVAAFLASNVDAALDDDLFVVWFGANDVHDALQALSTAPTPEAALGIIAAALEATASNIQALYAAGARSFLVPNVPNLAVTPAVRSVGTEAVAAATILSAAYNTELDDVLDQLSAALPQIEILQLDISALLGSVVLQPDAYGLSDTLTPCLRFDTIDHAVCTNADEHLFWDGFHPTAAAHGILADAAYELLTASLAARGND